MSIGQSDGGIFSVKVLSSQMTLAFVKLTSNQPAQPPSLRLFSLYNYWKQPRPYVFRALLLWQTLPTRWQKYSWATQTQILPAQQTKTAFISNDRVAGKFLAGRWSAGFEWLSGCRARYVNSIFPKKRVDRHQAQTRHLASVGNWLYTYQEWPIIDSLNSWVKFRLFHFLLLLVDEPICCAES